MRPAAALPTSRILALGHHVPPRVVDNHELSRRVGLSAEEIHERTGIRERRFVDPGTSCSDLALYAAEDALRRGGLRREQLDCIVFATLSPDHFFPGSACFLQAKLGLPGIPALDVRNQCSGFLYGLAIADHFVRLGTYRCVLVVGAEIQSSGLDFSAGSHGVSVLFGDGAGCAVLGPCQGESEVLATRLHADGRFARNLWVEAPSSTAPRQIDHADLERGAHYPQMRGPAVFRSAVRHMVEAVHETVGDDRVLADISLFVFHQANLRILQTVARHLALPADKLVSNVERYGNTTAASIPLALSEAELAGRLKRGDLVLMASFGAGYTWATALVRY